MFFFKVFVNGTKEYYQAFQDNRRIESNSTSTEIKLLRSGTRYHFVVFAVTGGGEGDGSSISNLLPFSGLLI